LLGRDRAGSRSEQLERSERLEGVERTEGVEAALNRLSAFELMTRGTGLR
jgi:hypothetical protein